jgi:hypothetical protein
MSFSSLEITKMGSDWGWRPILSLKGWMPPKKMLFSKLSAGEMAEG